MLESKTDNAGGLNLFMFETPNKEKILVAVNGASRLEFGLIADADFERI